MFQKLAKAHNVLLLSQRDPTALAAFNKAIKGIVFECAVNTWQNGGEPLITAFSPK